MPDPFPARGPDVDLVSVLLPRYIALSLLEAVSMERPQPHRKPTWSHWRSWMRRKGLRGADRMARQALAACCKRVSRTDWSHL